MHHIDWEDVKGTRVPAEPGSAELPNENEARILIPQYRAELASVRAQLKESMRVWDEHLRVIDGLRAQLQEQKENWDEEHSVMEEMLERSQRINAEKLAASEATIQRYAKAIDAIYNAEPKGQALVLKHFGTLHDRNEKP